MHPARRDPGENDRRWSEEVDDEVDGDELVEACGLSGRSGEAVEDEGRIGRQRWGVSGARGSRREPTP